MAKHIVKGYVTHEQTPYQSKPTISFYNFKPSAEYFQYVTIIREHEIEVEVPDDFNPTPQMVAALEEQKRQLRLKLASDLATIDDRISKLSAIAYEPPVTVGVFEDIDGVF
jgi:hypothetical protein